MKIALIGFGTVGQEFARLLDQKKSIFRKEYGFEPELVFVEDSSGQVYDKKGLEINEVLSGKEEKEKVASGKDFDLRELEYDLLVECTPTNIENGEPGLSNILRALRDGKDVVTSNKGPLAVAWNKLRDVIEENGSRLRFEAAVGGAMPIINLANDSLAGNEIEGIRGILNGTCNYILTRMSEGELPYHHVLSEAQDLGIAEADPSFDVEGIDTALKIVILANSVLNKDVCYEDVDVTGITGITPEALNLANEENKVVKLVGEVNGEKLEVAPKMVPVEHPLAVKGVLNVASIKTDLAGEITVTGKGAGASETASSILSDLLALKRERKN